LVLDEVVDDAALMRIAMDDARFDAGSRGGVRYCVYDLHVKRWQAAAALVGRVTRVLVAATSRYLQITGSRLLALDQ
jgi:hypothetical protein